MKLLSILTLSVALTTCFSCSPVQKEDAVEVAIDIAEEVVDEAVEHYTGVDPEFDFNGNDNKKEEN